MLYLEYIERDRFVPIEVFRYLADQGASWAEGHIDQMILQLGRTMRVGPMPSYLCFWRIPTVDRLDAWESYFSSDAAFRDRRGNAVHRSIHIQRAGLYDELLPGDTLSEGQWYAEYFDAPSHAIDATVLNAFRTRAEQQQDARLRMVLRRVGFLGPDPANLAIWSAPSFAAFEVVARSALDCKVVDIRTAGFYRRLGEETL
jgi:hypothetical protein